MRAVFGVFGLVGLLVAIGIIVVVLSMYLDQSSGPLKKGLDAREEARQISGRGLDNEPAIASFETEGISSGSRLSGLRVTSVTLGGAMDSWYGLMKDDEIVRINGMNVNDVANGDEELGKSLVHDAFARQQPITVKRHGQEFELPRDRAAAAAAATAASAAATAAGGAPAAPAPPAAPAAASDGGRGSGKDPLQQQLDAIPGVVR
jgi:hypothetical protein